MVAIYVHVSRYAREVPSPLPLHATDTRCGRTYGSSRGANTARKWTVLKRDEKLWRFGSDAAGGALFLQLWLVVAQADRSAMAF